MEGDVTIRQIHSFFIYFRTKIKSPPWSSAFWMVPYWGTLGELFRTAVLKLPNNSSDDRNFSWFSMSSLIRYFTNTLLSGTSFSAPLVIAFRLGRSCSFCIPFASPPNADLVLNMDPLKQASAIKRVCLDCMLPIKSLRVLFPSWITSPFTGSGEYSEMSG